MVIDELARAGEDDKGGREWKRAVWDEP